VNTVRGWKRERVGAVVAAVCGLAGAFPAAADTVTLTRLGQVDGIIASVTFAGRTYNTFAGLQAFNITEGTGAGASLLGLQTGFLAALDPINTPRPRTQVFSTTDLRSASDWGSYSSAQLAAINQVLGTASASASANTAAMHGALQLAIWEVTTDFNNGPLSVSAGAFRAAGADGSAFSADVATCLDELFAGIGQATHPAPGAYGLGAPDGPAPPIIIVPLPAAVYPALAVLAGMGVVATKRRRR
jgi:hypothetical protein